MFEVTMTKFKPHRFCYLFLMLNFRSKIKSKDHKAYFPFKKFFQQTLTISTFLQVLLHSLKLAYQILNRETLFTANLTKIESSEWDSKLIFQHT